MRRIPGRAAGRHRKGWQLVGRPGRVLSRPCTGAAREAWCRRLTRERGSRMGLKKGVEVKPASGKLGVLMPGMGAVATTFVSGVLAVRRGLAKPIGSLTQMGTIRLGKRTDNRVPTLKEYVPLATLDDLCFGGWDLFPEDMYQAALKAGVLEKDLLSQLKDELSAIKPMTAVFEQNWVKKLNGTHIKKGSSKMDLAEQVMADIKKFQKDNGCD